MFFLIYLFKAAGHEIDICIPVVVVVVVMVVTVVFVVVVVVVVFIVFVVFVVDAVLLLLLFCGGRGGGDVLCFSSKQSAVFSVGFPPPSTLSLSLSRLSSVFDSSQSFSPSASFSVRSGAKKKGKKGGNRNPRLIFVFGIYQGPNYSPLPGHGRLSPFSPLSGASLFFLFSPGPHTLNDPTLLIVARVFPFVAVPSWRWVWVHLSDPVFADGTDRPRRKSNSTFHASSRRWQGQ